MAQTGTTTKTFMQRMLDTVEVVGNKVPHPAVIFLIMAGVVIVLSHILYLAGTSVQFQVMDLETHTVRQSTATVNSLVTVEGLRFMLTSMVRNFLGFGPVGVILVAMVGVGLAEEAGLVKAIIRKIVIAAPAKAISFIIIFMGVLSSVASDAGYLVLIPLGAGAFIAIGRHPVAGIAAAFAGVSAVFGVNMLLTPVDGVLTELTNDAIRLLNPTMSINLTANLYFSAASVIVMSIVCTIVTDRIVEPRLGKYTGENPDGASEAISEAESKGLRAALYALIGVVAVVLLLALPTGAPLRHPVTGALIGDTPLMNSLIVVIMFVFLATGAAYGWAAGTVTSVTDGIGKIAKTFSTLGGLLFLFLVISQFLAYFNYTNMATIAAVNLADFLKSANLGAVPLLLGFVFVTALLNMIIPAAIAKWAILAPIFVPLFMKLGVDPDVVLGAYRVADSPGNVITPLMAYFGMIVIAVQRFQKDAGVGTVVAMMLPYTVALYLVWIPMLVIWFLLGIPFGP